MVMWRSLVKRELQLLGRQKADWLNPLVFFLLVLSLFPLGIGPEPGMLKQIAPGLVWIAALLSVLLSAERLFKDDYRYGVIEQLVAGRQGLFSYVTAKICCHWLSTGVPLVLVSPLIAVLLGLDWQSWQVLVVTLLLGTPVLSLLSVLGAALTMAADKGGISAGADYFTFVYSTADFCQWCYGSRSHSFALYRAVGCIISFFIICFSAGASGRASGTSNECGVVCSVG